MLHITSFMQNIAKLNSKTNNNGPLSSSLNSHLSIGLNRNYSFIYDHNLKSYVYQYNNDDDETDEEIQGFWGNFRDKNADRKLSKKEQNKNTDFHDGYWGTFKDNHLNSDDLDKSEPGSPTSTFSLSSSINSLSRFRDISNDNDYEEHCKSLSSSFRETRLDFDYKTSKFKIQARKRDEMKILMQSLEDKESQFKKETIKSFESKCLLIDKSSQTSSNSQLFYSTKIKEINFLHFSTYNHPHSNRSSLNKFKNVFNTVSKLSKTINVFNGDFLNDITNKTDIPLLNNVHASMYDLNGFLRNYFNNHKFNELKTTAVSLCSNIFEVNNNNKNLNESISQNLFGNGNHPTMLFEYQNVKIGFMALIDNLVYDKLNKAIKLEHNQKDTVIFSNDDEDNELYDQDMDLIEYVDYLQEADRLSKQLRLCGANIIVCLINMDSETNEQRLVKEANDIDIIFSGYNNQTLKTTVDVKKNCFNNRYVIKTESNFDCLSLVTLRLDEFNSNKILDISINKYIVD